MIKKIILKTKLAGERPFSALLKVIYFNLIKINKFIIYEFDLTKSFDSPSLKGPDWEIKVLHYKELEKYIDESKDLPREFKMYEIDGVKYCVVILRNDQIAHICWIYMKGDKDRWFNLRDKEAHFNYGFTFPEFRGQGLFPQAVLVVAQWLKKKGFTRILMDVHEETVFMINSLKKVTNAKKIGTLTHWCFYRPKFKQKKLMKSKYFFKRFRKLIFTLKTLKETVNNQYGYGLMSYFRFLYYSVLRVNTFIVFENDLTKELPEHNLNSDFEVIKPTLEKLSLIREGKKLPREFYHDKIDNVKTCYLAFHGSEVAYIHWVFYKGDDSRFLVLSDDVAELNYITTMPKFRGRRLSARMMAYASKELQDSGYRKVMVVTYAENIPAIICLKQAGFREIKRIKALGPFHKKLKV